MKRTRIRQLLAWLLSFSMVVGILFGDAATVIAEEATEDAIGEMEEDVAEEAGYFARTINLGTRRISNPLVPEGEEEKWQGDWVYFGHKSNGVGVRYRVLDASTTEFGTDESTMLLESSSVLEDKTFHLEGMSDWTEAREYLNGEFLENFFSAGERNVIASSTKAEASEQDGNGSEHLRYVPLFDTAVFLLDAKEVTRSSYGYYDNKNNRSMTRVKKKSGENASWWLRSECQDEDEDKHYQGGVVSKDGEITCIAYKHDAADLTSGISPALNVKCSEVVFTSSIYETEAGELVGKSPNVISGDETLPVVKGYNMVDNVGHEWKLTLKSEDAAPEITDIELNDVRLSFSWSGEAEGANKKLSAIITSGEGENETILHYGVLANVGAKNGRVAFNLPSGFDSRTHKLKVFFEQRNGDGRTDYAGEMAEVAIPDRIVVPTPTVTPLVTEAPTPTVTPLVTEAPTSTPKVETGEVSTHKPAETPAPTEEPVQTPESIVTPDVVGQPTMAPPAVTTEKPVETAQATASKAPTAAPVSEVDEPDEPDEPDDEVSSEETSHSKKKTTTKTKDKEPKTGEGSVMKAYATVAMVAGLSYLLLYFADEECGMTEEKKRELVMRLARWAKKGGRLRRAVAFAAIIALLVYYHAIGKRVSASWKEVCEES